MSKLVGLSGLSSLDRVKSLTASRSGVAQSFSIPARVSSDSVSAGSFVNLKLTAEKLVKEQASAKTDLQLAYSKLKKLTEDISVLEEKLQNAYNENAKLKVKQKEDEKLWNGLDSKFSSTKTLCDQLTETLQHLAGQVQEAEKNKAFFEDKLSASSVALDNLHDQMKALSLRVESLEETIRNCGKELKELGVEKEKMEEYFRDEQTKATSIIAEKDATIQKLEATAKSDGLEMETLKSKLEELNLESRQKGDELRNLSNISQNLEKEKCELISSNKDVADRLEMALQEVKNLHDFVNFLAMKLTELDNQSRTFSEKVIHLNALFDNWFKMVHEEKELAGQHAGNKFDQLHNQYTCIVSERDSLQLSNQDLNNKVIALQKDQECAMVQHAEECHLTEEKIRNLESEIESLCSKKMKLEVLVTNLRGDIETLSENSKLSDKNMQEVLSKLAQLEIENKDFTDKQQLDLMKKDDEINHLQKEIEKYEERLGSLDNQISQITNALEEKDRHLLELKNREKELGDQKAEIQESLIDTESRLTEAKKQYELMLESKQLELSRHLKDISQKNDQAINEIRQKYEMEKVESINLEKEKADKLVGEMKKKCEQQLVECKEESRQYLLRVREEHAVLVSRIQQEHDKREMNLLSCHKDEIKRIQLQAENELREKIISLRNEHDGQLSALKCKHEDECRRLQEELDIQKSKEEKQRALLQMQWKVMGNNLGEDQEVTSRKNYSVSSAKKKHSENGKWDHHAVDQEEVQEKDSTYLRANGTPVSNLLRKVDKVNTGSVMSLPKSRKVTHHEYEVETKNDGTVTKRRRTRSTVMFGAHNQEMRKPKKKETPKANTPRHALKGTKDTVRTKPANIGDLFSEGSLNPYTDDPYAFD
nr:synaptonemal complex protein 1-like isoform X1 [Ipomoea trifida]